MLSCDRNGAVRRAMQTCLSETLEESAASIGYEPRKKRAESVLGLSLGMMFLFYFLKVCIYVSV